MIPTYDLLHTRVEAALRAALQLAPEAHSSLPLNFDSAFFSEAARVVPCSNPQFGDYQWNGALPLAKTLKTNPRVFAQRVIDALDVADVCAPPEIAGPGFVNLRLRPDFLEAATRELLNDSRCGVPQVATPRSIVVDFSSPNVAKPMHVGHIRSTIIGDAIARLLRFAGHRVVTDNHIGDWGTAFGKVIIGWKTDLDEPALADDAIAEMGRLYQIVNARASTNPAIEEQAREETAKLQSGDAQNRAIWERVRFLSQEQFDAIYARLNVQFDVTLGESFYNNALPVVVNEMLRGGIARESEGAVAVFSDHALSPKDDPFLIFRDGAWHDTPTILRKRDGAATYAATDLATLDYRVREFAADEVLYVTGAPQALHFRQVFNAFARWKPNVSVQPKHVAFGSVLGEDRQMLKARSGESIKLIALLDEAQERALAAVRERYAESEMSDEQAQHIAGVVGMGAVKYADLSQNRLSDYVFSFDKMLALQGNTAPYLLNAYVRTRAIFRRAGVNADTFQSDALQLHDEAEIALCKALLRFPLVLETALADYRVNALCDYLFEVAGLFHAFFEACPVLKSEEPLRSSRLNVCLATGKVLALGLNLLGLQTLEQM